MTTPSESALAAVLRYCVQDDAKAGPSCSGCPGCPVVGGPVDCVFCSIATGATRADIVDEGETWTSFPPLGPHVPGHLLFISRRHVSDATIEPALTGTVFAAASAYLGRVLKSEGNILTSVGAAATQTVKHLHVHVIPRGPEDGLSHDWPWLRDDQETLDTVREQRDDVLELLDAEREQHREHLAAILAATDARTEADGLEGVESVLRERMNEVMISAQGSLAEDRCEVLHPDEYDGTGACVECSEHAADLLHDGWDERIVAPVLARIAHLEAALAAAEATALLKVADEWRDRWVKDGKHHGIPGCYSPGYERNLRERATLTTTQPAPTEPPC